VQDTTPPSVTITFAPPTGWVRNGQLIPIPVTVTATDLCDAAPTIECKAWSLDSHGIRQDYVLVWVNGQLALVRPVPQLFGGDATYTLECSATDASGNRGSSSISLAIRDNECQVGHRD
jgi:hypothetical protein